jgi:hypothetical protein
VASGTVSFGILPTIPAEVVPMPMQQNVDAQVMTAVAAGILLGA